MPPVSVNPRAVLGIVLITYLMIILDISIVITGLPKIRDDLGFSQTALSWVQNAYTLTFGGLLLLGARAGDILGRRRVFVGGLALFSVASLLVGVSSSSEMMIAARAVQGCGAAILAPSTLALLQAHFPEGPERTRAIGYYGAMGGIGAAIGLVVGGLLADWLSWRDGFFVNLPIGLALVACAYRFLPETERRPGTLDVAGAATSTLAMAALVYGLVRSAEEGWGDRVTLATLAAGVALSVAFVVTEARAPQPIMPLRLFASHARSAAYAARLLFLGGMVGFWFYTTQLLQGVMGFSPAEAGLAFLPTTIVNFAAAMAVPRLTPRVGNGRILAGGLAVGVIGMAWLAQATAQSSYLSVVLPMALIGAGQGGVLSPLTIAGVAGVAPEDAGAASGVVNVFHQLGNSLGLAVLVVVFAATGSAADPVDLLAERVSAALLASTVFLAMSLAVVLAVLVRRRPAPEQPSIAR